MSLLQLLGSPKLVTKDSVVDIPPKQALLLGSYLAYKEDWASRDELVHLFWPDESEKTARHNLSQLLYHCKQQVWMQGLEAERQRVRWLIDTDVKRFQQALGNGHWKAAAKHYEGNLLEGVITDYAASFEDWLFSERESLKNAWREAVLNHAKQLETEQNFSDATQVLRNVLNQDPLAEDVLQAFMRCAIQDGQREQALKSYDFFAKQLKQDLDMEPLAATQALAKDLRVGQHQSFEQAPKLEEAVTETKLFGFPNNVTPFIGRDLERAELAQLYSNADTRLITLLGAGGIGKTRLAMQVAKEQAYKFKDGVLFVSLATLEDASLIATQLLQTLALTTTKKQSDSEFLADYCATKNMLLVFDNTEHLPDSIDLIIELLESCPNLRFLVTSREALSIQFEHIYDLRGLNYPHSDNEANLEAFDAVNLFLRAARRSQANFHLTNPNKQGITAICKLLQGSPLGLELAAAWVRLMNPSEIAEELKHNLDLLKTDHKDLAERHQSLRAVFEYSWALLSDAEQETLAQLAVFRGSFTKDAALAVTNASLRTLLALVNKSLLQRTQTGRFERHIMVQQFAFEKLKASTKQPLFSERHAEHFLNLSKDIQAQLKSSEQLEYLERLDDEHANFRAALNWSLNSKRADLALHLAANLGHYWEVRGYYTEGRDWLTKCFTASDSPDPKVLAQALNASGNLARIQSDYPESRRLLEQGLSIYKGLKLEASIAQVLNNLGLTARSQGDFKEAKALLSQSLVLQRNLQDDQGIAQALNNLSIVAFWYSNYTEAQGLLEESLKISKKHNNKLGMANALNNLGNALRSQGKYKEAQRHQEESLRLFRELKGKHGISQTLNNLALVAVELNEVDKAHDYLLESLELKRESNEKQGIAGALTNLGMLSIELNKMEDAKRYLNEALNLHKGFKDKIGVAITLNIKGDWARKQQDYALAKSVHTEALELFKQLNNSLGQAEALTNLSRVALAQSNFKQTEKLSKESLKLHHSINNPRGIADTLDSLASSYYAQQNSKALSLWAATNNILKSINSSRSTEEQAAHEQQLEEARVQFGLKVFEQAWRLGEGFSQQDAVAFAFDEAKPKVFGFTDKPSTSH